jgi:hypothetical protein
MHLTTGKPTFLYVLDFPAGRIVCPLVEREFNGYLDVATPSGLSGFVGIGPWSEIARKWSDFVRERGYVTGYIGLHPLFEPSDIGRVAVQHNSIYFLDLTMGRDALLRRMDRNRRRELRGWELRKNEFVFDRGAISAFLVAAYEPFMRQMSARSVRLAPQTLDALSRSERCVAVATASAGRIDAAYLFAATRYAGECLINVATPNGRTRATDLMWYGVSTMIDRGVPQLNLGGGAQENDSVAKAKQRFGPHRLPLRSLRQVYRPDVYAELCRQVEVDPTDENAYFPAYRSPAAGRLSEATT